MNKTYLRGELYYADLGIGIGSEQKGYRPVLIIQNNIGNKHSSTVIVAAISSRISGKKKLPTHCYLNTESGLPEPSVALLEQIRTVDKHRLTQYIGKLPAYQMRCIDHALAISLGFIAPETTHIVLCLCRNCADNFFETGSYHIRRVDPTAFEKEDCTYCGQRRGYDYIISKKERRE